MDYTDSLLESFFRDFLPFMHSKFESKEALFRETNRTLRNPIINSGDGSRDHRKRDAGRARYKSKGKLLMKHLENDGERVWAARTRAALDVWLAWHAALLQLDGSGRYSCSLPNIGGRLRLTRKGAEAQTWHKELVVRGRQSLGHLFIVTGDVSAHLYVTQGAHIYTDYHRERKELLRRAFVIEEVRIPPSSVFAGHGYVQHVGSELRGSHCTRYHTKLIAENHDLPDASASAYRDCIYVWSRADTLSLKIEGGTKEADVDVEDSENGGSKDNDEKN